MFFKKCFFYFTRFFFRRFFFSSFFLFLGVIYFFLPNFCFASTAKNIVANSWYRDVGDWIASRTVRQDVTTEPTNKILSDMKRFDVSLGKRLPLYTWSSNEEEKNWTLGRAFSVGLDGGMAVTLTRTPYSTRTSLIFLSETFDGFFGIYFAYFFENNIFMLRNGHLSAHLIDNSQYINDPGPISYSLFWTEFVIGRNFLKVQESSRWDLYVQGSLGLTYKSQPMKRNPRATFGIDTSYGLTKDPQCLSVIASFDARAAGIVNQKANYVAFLGIGRPRRPELHRRPFRFGVGTTWGSDYRHQFYNRRAHFTGLELQTEF